jgi:hypothetical protein
MSWKHGRRWLITAVLVIMPFGGAVLLLYVAGRLAVGKRRRRGTTAEADPGAPLWT